MEGAAALLRVFLGDGDDMHTQGNCHQSATPPLYNCITLIATL